MNKFPKTNLNIVKKYNADIKDKISIKRDSKVQVLDMASLKEIDSINDVRKSFKSNKKTKEKVNDKIRKYMKSLTPYFNNTDVKLGHFVI